MTAALARAAHHAHRLGVVHRDLKPGNVLLTADGRPKITDFGLAKRLQPGEASEPGCRTLAGAILGTPSYLAPEQAEGNACAAGPAVDVYALGAVLYEMLTGRPPFQGASVLETLEQVRSREPAAPTSLRPKTPRDLENICLKCRARNRDAVTARPRRWPTTSTASSAASRRARPTCVWERGWKRLRRNPVVTLLSAVLACTAAALLVLGGWSYACVRQTLTDLGREHQSVLEKNEELQGVNRRLRQVLAELGKEQEEVQQMDEELDAATLSGREATPPAALYELGCVYALCGATAKGGGAVDYASRAMAMLERADDAGYFHDPKNLIALRNDAGLTSLRGRADFRALQRKVERERNASTGPKP